MIAETLLRSLVAVDPWGPSDSETGASSCHFCGSDQRARYGEPERYEHWQRCEWWKAASLLDMVPPTHHPYVAPPPEPPCPTCGFQMNNDKSKHDLYGPENTGSVEAHHTHLAREAGFETVAEWFDDMHKRMWREAFPAFTASRGAISFIGVTDLSNIREVD